MSVDVLDVVAVVGGVALLLATVSDVFTTVFVPRGGAGWLTSRLYGGVWALWTKVACAGGIRRRRLLAAAGPVLLPLTVVLWVAQVTVAFALIYLPSADQFSVPTPQSQAGWASVLYVSAYSTTTLGVGDVYAATAGLRLLTTLQAAIGFALFSIAITYLLSVYNALQRATALALAVASYLGRVGDEDPVDLVCRTVTTGSEGEVLTWLGQITNDLAATSQAQRQYPLIAYFHVPTDDRALPLALQDLLVLITICRTLLDRDQYPALSSGPTMTAAWRSAAQFAGEHGSELGDGDIHHGERGRRLYDSARARLIDAGVAVRAEPAAAHDFLAVHENWYADAQQLLRHFRYQDEPPRGAT